MSTTTIYILQLKHGKYYVGKSADPVRRLKEHQSGKGSEWTRLHPPVKMVQTIPGASPFDEDRYVKEYMLKYGVDNVRGGSYSNPELDELQEYALQQEIRGATDCCMRCGRKGHFVQSCYAKTDVDGASLDDSDEDEEEEDDEEDNEEEEEEKQAQCFRCGREGHYWNECYTRTTAISSSIKTPQKNTCDHNHPLQIRTVYDTGRRCDQCETYLPRGCTVSSCVPCDFDLCSSCHSATKHSIMNSPNWRCSCGALNSGIREVCFRCHKK